MNSKALWIVIFALILLNIFTLLFLKGKTPLKNTNTFEQVGNKNLTLPTDPYQKGIDNVKVVYLFSGKVTEIKDLEGAVRIGLDSSVQDAPEFTTTARTTVIKTGGDKATPATIKDIELGQNITISDAYNLKTKVWELDLVQIKE